MSNQTDYAEKIDAIRAIPSDQVRSPRMPVESYLQESENLYQWAQSDREPLEAAGLDWTLVEDIPARAGALRQAEANWFESRFSHQDGEKQWLEQSKAGYLLRDDLLRDFRYAFRKDANLLKRVAQISEGNGHDDMIQDLQNLAVLGNSNLQWLQPIRFDPQRLEQAAEMADSLAELLAKANTDRLVSSQQLVLRNQAFSYLKQAVDELRHCGQYVFWNDEQRLRAYRVQYFRKQRAARRNNNTNDHNDSATVTPLTTQAAPNQAPA